MYQEIEMWKSHKKEKVEAEKLQHQHEVIGSIYALTYFGVLAIIASYLV